MELSYDKKAFQTLNYDEMLIVDGGITWDQAYTVMDLAIGIVGIAITPALIIYAAGPVAVLAAAAGGVWAMVSLIHDIT